MNKNAQLDSPPDEPPSPTRRTQQIVEFWRALYDGGDSGAAPREELESLEHEVTDALAKTPPDLNKAESLTAKAMLRIAGLKDL